MTVVINEFEVVPEAEPAVAPPVAAEAAPPAPPALSAPEVDRVLQHLAERRLRVEAH